MVEQAADRRSEILLGRARLLVLGGLETAAPRTKVPAMDDANYIIDYGDLLDRSSFFERIGLIAGFVLVALIAADRRVTSSRPLGPRPLKLPH
jgi:hypothetical protein